MHHCLTTTQTEMKNERRTPWVVFPGSRSPDAPPFEPGEETKESPEPASNEANASNEGTALLFDNRQQQQQQQRISSNQDTTCCDVLIDFCLHGFCPPESYYKAQPNEGKKTWKFWHCWHPTANLKQIFIRDRDSNLNCLDGIRALAYLWVLNDHVYQVFNASVPGFTAWWANYGGIVTVEQGEKGDQGVTSFFVLSGFLIPFILTKEVTKRKERYLTAWTALDFLFHRYVRLAPTLYTATALAMLYGYYSTLTYSRVAFYENCQNDWWLNVVFLENYFSLGHWNDCYDSVWTISVEMQLYVLTLPVVYFFVWDKLYGYIAALCFFLASFITRVALAQWITDKGLNMGTYNQYIYLASWSRAAEYGIGIMLFMTWDKYIYEKQKATNTKPATTNADVEALPASAVRNSMLIDNNGSNSDANSGEEETPAPLTPWQITTKVLFFGALVGAIVFAFFFLSMRYEDWWFYSVYQYYAFTYTIWAMGLFAVIYLSMDPPIWPISQFLGMSIWYPIASLAYTGGTLNILICAIYGEFLVNLNPVDTWPAGTPYYWKFLIFIQVSFLSLMCGLVLSLLVERPLMQLGQRVKFMASPPITSLEQS